MSDTNAENAEEAPKAGKVTMREPRTAPASKFPKGSGAWDRPEQKEFEIEDALGRMLTIRKATPSMRYGLAKMLGGDSSTNLGYMGMLWAAICVIKIDGEWLHGPAQEAAVGAWLDRVGDEGIAAVNQVYVEQGWAGGSEVDAAAVKN